VSFARNAEEIALPFHMFIIFTFYGSHQRYL